MTSPIETNNVVERESLCGVEQPKRIWLMVYRHAGDVCWTSDPNPDDADEIETVEYVRADLAQSLSDRIDVQRQALVKCRTQFLEYERHHRDEAERLMLERDTSKVAVARLAKAARNREMAEMIDASLTQGGKNATSVD